MDEKYYEQIKNNIDAAFKEAKARKDFAEFEYKQQVQLFQKGVTGKMGVEESKLKAELAIAKYQQVQAKLNLADFDLKSCCIPSPINGRVLKKVAHEFEFVRAGEPVVELIDDTGLLAVMHFPSSTVNDIHEGGKFNIKIAETGKVYKAIITGISAKVDARSQTFEVKARIDNKDGNLRAGMSGQIVK
jgi:RND family efflux transporter MFP subunit